MGGGVASTGAFGSIMLCSAVAVLSGAEVDAGDASVDAEGAGGLGELAALDVAAVIDPATVAVAVSVGAVLRVGREVALVFAVGWAAGFGVALAVGFGAVVGRLVGAGVGFVGRVGATTVGLGVGLVGGFGVGLGVGLGVGVDSDGMMIFTLGGVHRYSSGLL